MIQCFICKTVYQCGDDCAEHSLPDVAICRKCFFAIEHHERQLLLDAVEIIGRERIKQTGSA
jgi:hypothetical protein